jgi:two-component system cell cycle response regulator CpdR
MVPPTINSGEYREMARILLAEDDDSMRDFLAKALKRAGHEVISCADGDEGLSVFEGQPDGFDLLLTDIVMPGIDGIELARRAAETVPGLKIMFITGFAAVALNPGSGAPTQAKVLSKPFHLRELVDEVARVMAA